MVEEIQMKSLSESILKTLLYYDIFLYPLTSSEVFQYLPTNHVSEREVNERLHQLANQSIIYRLGHFFSVQNKAGLETRRSAGNQMASASMKLAARRANLIARFPFVRGVLISGSLAKGYMDENSDLDFFIITAPGRLWIARTLLVLYKRLFLFNSHKYFCVNYFIDSGHLEIEEKNLFTATEMATLIPMCNGELYVELLAQNGWIKSFFPNYKGRSVEDLVPEEKSGVQRIGEYIINFLFANKLEKLFKSISMKRWLRHYGREYDREDFQVTFKTTDSVSKNHPHNYQRKVMEAYKQKLGDFAGFGKLNRQT